MKQVTFITWEGNISIDKYSGDVWHAFKDINIPEVQANITEVISRPELFEGFELYIAGGAIEDWITWDIDWALIGPYDPVKIKIALDWITECGFKHGIYPDVVYTAELFDLHAWQRGSELKDRWVYRTHNTWSKLGSSQDMPSYKEVENGLYRAFQKCPYKKNIERNAEGYKYHKPLKII